MRVRMRETMAISSEVKNEALDKLKSYSGKNPYLLSLQKEVIFCQKFSVLTDFAIEYIIKNADFSPRPINKVVKLTDWYGEYLQKNWNIDFSPKLLKITWFLGETETSYHVYAQYRQSVPAFSCFLSKKGVMTNFLMEDYHNIQVDFDRYDNLSRLYVPEKPHILKSHQKEGVKFLLSRKKCILADDMGLGKTTELAVASVEGNFDVILIICPASLKTNWFNELSFYIPSKDISIIGSVDDFKKEDLEKYLGYGVGKSGLKREELLQEAKAKGKWTDNRYVIINYDILDDVYTLTRARRADKIAQAEEESPMLKFIKNKKSLIIIDEAQNYSNMTSNRYKITMDLINKGKPTALYLATGTPITNNPANFYCLLKLLNDPISADYKEYVEHYCRAIHVPWNAKEKKKRDAIQGYFLANHHKNSWYDLTQEEKDELNKEIEKKVRIRTIPNGGSNLEELKERTSHIYLRRVKEDLVNEDGTKSLPPKYIHERWFDLDAIQLMEYNKLWEEYIEEKILEYFNEHNGEINYEDCRIRVQEMADKGLLEGGIYRKYLSNLMVPHTEEIVDRCIAKNEKVVIACCFDDELYTLQEYFGDKCVVYNGKMSQTQKDNAQAAFMTDPNIMVFIGNIKAAGVGITLTASRVLVFNNISYVPSDDQQMQDRIHRIGQTRDVHIYYQFFHKTQYEKMWDKVKEKSEEINQVIKKEDEK